MTNDLPDNATVLETRIPEGHAVSGLAYGRHVSTPGWSGYYVSPAYSGLWGVVRETPVDDECEGSDAATVAAIRRELRETLPPDAMRLVVCRSDHGDGGWSLHPPDGSERVLLDGTASPVDPVDHPDGDQWDRPNDADRQLATAIHEADEADVALINPWSGAWFREDYSELTDATLSDMAAVFDADACEWLHDQLAGTVSPGRWLAVYVAIVGPERAGAQVIGG